MKNLMEDPSLILRLRERPEIFNEMFLGVTKIWEGQSEILTAIAKHRRVIVPSGHSLGKDYIASCIILWFLLTHIPSIVVATAPSARQVEKVIWGELENKIANARMPIGGRLLSNQLIMDMSKRWYAIGFTTKDIRRTPGKFQGFHQRHVMLIFSEAQAIEKAIWDQGESLMTAANVKWLALGNPLVSFGPFIDALSPKSGWHSIRLDAEKNPNFLEKKEIIHGLASYEWVEEMRKKYGSTHPIFLAKINGIAPKKSIGSFIEPAWIEFANGIGMECVPEDGPMVIGADIAGFGSDKTVITVRRGGVIIETKKFEKRSTMETTGELVGFLNAGASRVFVDSTGIGTGVVDRLVELGYGDRVVGVNFGARPYDEDTLTNTSIPTSQKYADAITQLYHEFAGMMEAKKVAFPMDDDRNLQLLNRRISIQSNGKMKLESKKDYMARGFDSPDEADSLVLAYADSCMPIQSMTPYINITEEPVLKNIWG